MHVTAHLSGPTTKVYASFSHEAQYLFAAGASHNSGCAIILTGSNCWPADSKELLELLTVQKAGGWRCEVGSVSL